MKLMEETIKQLIKPPKWCSYPQALGCYLLYNKQNLSEADCVGCDAYNKLKNK